MKSRWEESKKQSNWHFDYQKKSIDYTYVCRFDYDFSKQIELYSLISSPKTWWFDDDQSAIFDLKKNKANINQEVFSRTDVSKDKVFNEIAKSLGFIEYEIYFNNQKTGQLLHLHFDLLKPEEERYIVMLSDWKPGHLFQLGNSMFYQWKSGDCITWNWKDIPHCTANASWWDRPMLQITGKKEYKI